MGNWHCVDSNCATVRYRQYQGAKIRWRYGSEAWKEIAGDDYLTRQFTPPCPGQVHELNYGRQNVIGNSRSCSPTNITVFAPITSWSGSRNAPFSNLRIHAPDVGFEVIYPDPFAAPAFTKYWCRDYNFQTYFYVTDNTGTERRIANTAALGFSFINFQVSPASVNNCPPSQCTFKVFKNNQVVHEETRLTCPEVEKIPCSLSDIEQKIEIKKLPFLERVEVRDQSIETIFVSPLEAPLLDTKPLPSNCYNVYKTYILAPPILSDYVPLPGAINPYQYIAQICSAVDCPPPEYQVICDCDSCESCPNGTCAVECNEQICCYGSDGVSVKAIATRNYCGGQS
jgi:hypothetical protein